MAVKTKPKRIYNPVTGKYYEIRQRSTKQGKAGQIKGLWSSNRKSSAVQKKSESNKK